jgi:hypothetical protein
MPIWGLDPTPIDRPVKARRPPRVLSSPPEFLLRTLCHAKRLPRSERFGVNPSTVQRISRPFDDASVAVA